MRVILSLFAATCKWRSDSVPNYDAKHAYCT